VPTRTGHTIGVAGSDGLTSSAAAPSLRERITQCDACGVGHLAPFRQAREIAVDRAALRRGFGDAVLDGPADVFRCEHCGTLFRDPRRFEALERSYAHWRYTARDVERLRVRALADYQHDRHRLRRYGARPGAELLEIGSYVGGFLDFAAASGCDIVGVDLNPTLVEWARRRGHDARAGSLSQPGCLPSDVDGVWILNCFEELSDMTEALRTARKLLRPGGQLIIRTPNAGFAAATHRQNHPVRFGALVDAGGLTGLPFRRCLTVAGIVTLLNSSGFVVDEIHGREFSSQRPRGYGRVWTISRPARSLLYSCGSAVCRAPMHPWLDVLASSP
jgi:SAM-dependent methyltransferase